MNKTTTKKELDVESANANEESSWGEESASVSRDLQGAQERVLLYLKALGIPPIHSLEIAHLALSNAKKRFREKYDGDPPVIRLAMESLHRLLETDPRLLENTVFSRFPTLQRHWRIDVQDMPARSTPIQDPVAMPPIKRGHMRIKEL